VKRYYPAIGTASVISCFDDEFDFWESARSGTGKVRNDSGSRGIVITAEPEGGGTAKRRSQWRESYRKGKNRDPIIAGCWIVLMDLLPLPNCLIWQGNAEVCPAKPRWGFAIRFFRAYDFDLVGGDQYFNARRESADPAIHMMVISNPFR